ncbi:MAG: hypothetical protein V2I43_24950, partial [Parvularcula sp.]|nr:hypothetical protein [Parvularcula sp.]
AHSHFFALDDASLERFAEYTGILLEAKARELGTCRKTKFPLRSDRVCLKILNAPWMIDWFCRQVDADIITIVRHPAAQALSVLRQGWAFPLEAYATRIRQMNHSFTEAQMAFIEEAMARGDPWTKALVDWVITSLPLREGGDHSVIRVRYEDVVANKAGFVDDVLIGRCGLSDKAAMIKAISRPSGSSRMSQDATNRAIQNNDSEHLRESWKKSLNTQMLDKLADVLDRFEIEYD